MTRFSFRGVAAAFALAAACIDLPAQAQEALDQQNAPASWGGAMNNLLGAHAQTFTPTQGCLTHVDIGLGTLSQGKGGDQVTLAVLDRRVSPAREIAKVTLPVQEGFDGWLSFPMPGGGVELPPGRLALQVVDTGKLVFGWKYQTGNPYPGGEYYGGSGAVDVNRDFLFRSYGRAVCRFGVGVAPDPVVVARGGSVPASVNVTRMGGFQAPVIVSFTAPAGVLLMPPQVPIAGPSTAVTVLATSAAHLGTLAVTASATSGTETKTSTFHVQVTSGPPAARIDGVLPAVQVRNGIVMVNGSGFEPNCALNTVFIAGLNVTPTVCTANLLSANVPPQARFGPGTLTVMNHGVMSNAVAFSVGRDVGKFVDITSDVLYDANRVCAANTVSVSEMPGATDAAGSRALFWNIGANRAIGAPIPFRHTYTQKDAHGDGDDIEGVGGAGFSLCSTGIVFDGGDASGGRLVLRDLQTGADLLAHPYPVNIRVPNLGTDPRTRWPWTQDFDPRIYRSPDGTILLLLAAAPQESRDNGVAVFFDLAHGARVLKTLSINVPSTSRWLRFPASVSIEYGNRISFIYSYLRTENNAVVDIP